MARLAAEYFPACEQDDVLDGYALSGPNFLVEVVGELAGSRLAVPGKSRRALTSVGK